jgi:hypothetical protein
VSAAACAPENEPTRKVAASRYCFFDTVVSSHPGLRNVPGTNHAIA